VEDAALEGDVGGGEAVAAGAAEQHLAVASQISPGHPRVLTMQGRLAKARGDRAGATALFVLDPTFGAQVFHHCRYLDRLHSVGSSQNNHAIAEAVGLGEAVRFMEEIGPERIRAHEKVVAQSMLDALDEVPGLTIYGPRDVERRGASFSFSLDGVHPHDIGQFLDSKGVCVRAGHHCTKPLLRSMGVQSTARASAYLYTTDDDVIALRDALVECREWFGAA
jgi:hypothetical protein